MLITHFVYPRRYSWEYESFNRHNFGCYFGRKRWKWIRRSYGYSCCNSRSMQLILPNDLSVLDSIVLYDVYCCHYTDATTYDRLKVSTSITYNNKERGGGLAATGSLTIWETRVQQKYIHIFCYLILWIQIVTPIRHILLKWMLITVINLVQY